MQWFPRWAGAGTYASLGHPGQWTGGYSGARAQARGWDPHLRGGGHRRKVTPRRSGETGGVGPGAPHRPGCPPARAVVRPTLAGAHNQQTPAEALSAIVRVTSADAVTAFLAGRETEGRRAEQPARHRDKEPQSLGVLGSSPRGFSRVPQTPRAAGGPAFASGLSLV